ncbi:U11/U12 small nuclear ribonucleoprotein 48 kDa protein isoform X2 [Dromaius novaehollandiae]|uniref:U11/U12 small nuclear ribonucleoprotein 48 kDa protein isoform X2 n=1 Tax=Dromaius novaehollandiae TaxID=8790 RepID=UPI00311DD82E
MAAPCAVWFGDQAERVTCPYDAHHRMPPSSLQRHAASCRLRRMGYSKEEEEDMYDSSFFYEKLKIPTVKMDKDLQFHIVQQAKAESAKEGVGYNQGSYSSLPPEVPQNHKRFTCDLTQADRLALYDYVVDETKKQRSRSQITENDSDLFVDLAAKITQDDSQKGPKSHLEILAEMRDYKRRRQSYRAKNVHITKKSYTEVIRDVIGVHMEELSNHWQEENRLDNAEVCEGKTGGQVQWTHSSLVEAVRILIAQDIGGRPAGVQANKKGVVKEAKREILGEKEKGKMTSITAIKEESRSKNMMVVFVSCLKKLLPEEVLLLLLVCQGHTILALPHSCAWIQNESLKACQDERCIYQSATLMHLINKL